jgi:hypothetical protein
MKWFSPKAQAGQYAPSASKTQATLDMINSGIDAGILDPAGLGDTFWAAKAAQQRAEREAE